MSGDQRQLGGLANRVRGERTQRARDAVRDHARLIENCAPGTAPMRIAHSIRMIWGATDRHGIPFHEIAEAVISEAMTFAVMPSVLHEIERGVNELDDETAKVLPLTHTAAPSEFGVVIFPAPIRQHSHFDDGLHRFDHEGQHGVYDPSGGTTYDIDGLIWAAAGELPTVTLIPLTRYRGDPSVRPFRQTLELMSDPAPRVGDLVPAGLSKVHPRFADQAELVPPDAVKALAPEVASIESAAAHTVVELAARDAVFPRKLAWLTFNWLHDEQWVVESAGAIGRKLRRTRNADAEIPEDGRLVIIDLRPSRKAEAAKAKPGGKPPWWRIRWTVRGHWADRRYAIRDDSNMPVGPTTGPDAVEGVTFEYRKVWIDPYVKGPESAPLVHANKVAVVDVAPDGTAE